ncbi:hypothetical protein ACWGCW_36180 [Streptomyces sp. NPDC054933]
MAAVDHTELVRVGHFQRIFAMMTAAGAVLSEGLLLALIGTSYRLESLAVGTVAIALVSLALIPLSFRLPARLRCDYAQAAQIENVGQVHSEQPSASRSVLWRTARLAGVTVGCMLLMGLASHQVMLPVLLLPVVVSGWLRSKATARWEQENGATLWQRAPRCAEYRVPVFRAASDSVEPGL